MDVWGATNGKCEKKKKIKKKNDLGEEMGVGIGKKGKGGGGGRKKEKRKKFLTEV